MTASTKTSYSIRQGSETYNLLKSIKVGDMYVHQPQEYDPVTLEIKKKEPVLFVVLEVLDETQPGHIYFPEFRIFWTDIETIVTIDAIDMLYYRKEQLSSDDMQVVFGDDLNPAAINKMAGGHIRV